MQIDLNIPLPENAPTHVIAVARALRQHGFIAPAARVVQRLATGEWFLATRAEYNPRQPQGYTGVNGALRMLAQTLAVDHLSASTDGANPVFRTQDCGDALDGKVDPQFAPWDALTQPTTTTTKEHP